ncbi:UNVERIFIED_CONTAM: hypothetical protein K2H54_070659 [Gekko kuhli]
MEEIQSIQVRKVEIRKKKKLYAKGSSGKKRKQRRGRKGNKKKLKDHVRKFMIEEEKLITGKLNHKGGTLNAKLYSCKERRHVESLKLKDRLLIFRKKIKVYKG